MLYDTHIISHKPVCMFVVEQVLGLVPGTCDLGAKLAFFRCEPYSVCHISLPQETVTVQQVRSSVSGPVLSEKQYEFDRFVIFTIKS